MEAERLVCERDGAPTRLRCAKCEAGICPACLVRTPVGYKCRGCAGQATDRRRRSRSGAAVMAGIALVAALVAVVLLGGSSETTSDPVGVPTAGDAPTNRQVMMGEEARDGQLVFVVEDFACAAKQDPNGAAAAAPGKVCTLRFRVKNDSGSPAMLLGRFQYLVDAQSRTYGADEPLTRAVPENASRGISELNINPEVEVPMTFVFDLPDTVDPTEARFRGTGRSRFGVNVRLQPRA